MIIRFFILLLFALNSNIALAVNDKQFIIPGYGFIDQKAEDEQWVVPGYGFIDEEPAPAAGGDRRIIIISKKEKFNETKDMHPIDINDIVYLSKWYCVNSNK